MVCFCIKYLCFVGVKETTPRNISITQPKHVLLQTVIEIGHENIGLIL